MYSKSIEPFLKTAGIKVGDRLRYSRQDWSIEGLLMPRPDVGDPDCLVLKLSSGYNLGLTMDGAKVEKLEGAALDFLDMGSSSAAAISSAMEEVSRRSAHSAALGASSSVSGLKPANEAGHGKTRPPIYLLSTGGTIASKVDYVTGAVHPRMSADEILTTYPRLRAHGPYHSISLMRILSEDMHPIHWTTMARGVADAFRAGAEGIVIAHGTDTMGYSAAALSFALQDLPGPVLLTGAQRSPDRGSSEAGDNLFCTAAAARADFAAVGVCMQADAAGGRCFLHWGTRVRKCHTSARWAFRSIDVPPFGEVDTRTGEVRRHDDPALPHRDMGRKPKVFDKFSENVHLAWVYPGLSPKVVSSWSDFDGVVLAATGLGNAPVASDDPKSPRSILPAIRELIESGVIVAAAPQTLEGRVNLEVYSSGRLLREVGVIGHGADWLPETAYVKLAWALGQERDPKRVEKLLLAPIARDISPRSVLPADLTESASV